MGQSSMQYAKPIPIADPDSAGYWQAAREHRLAILRCEDCGYFIHEPRNMCPKCLSERVAWRQVSGVGTVYSFIVVHQRIVPGFEADVPYVVAVVELAEQPGLRLVSNILECAPAEVRVGMPVEVIFADVAERITLPQFRPKR